MSCGLETTRMTQSRHGSSLPRQFVVGLGWWPTNAQASSTAAKSRCISLEEDQSAVKHPLTQITTEDFMTQHVPLEAPQAAGDLQIFNAGPGGWVRGPRLRDARPRPTLFRHSPYLRGRRPGP